MLGATTILPGGSSPPPLPHPRIPLPSPPTYLITACSKSRGPATSGRRAMSSVRGDRWKAYHAAQHPPGRPRSPPRSIASEQRGTAKHSSTAHTCARHLWWQLSAQPLKACSVIQPQGRLRRDASIAGRWGERCERFHHGGGAGEAGRAAAAAKGSALSRPPPRPRTALSTSTWQ